MAPKRDSAATSSGGPPKKAKTDGQVRIAIDRGGTFTDAICSRPDGEDVVIKLLSVDPKNYKDAPTEAIRRILSQLDGPSSTEIPKGEPLPLDRIESIRMGTTVSTNALLERKGERCALVTSKGWGDVLLIGQQSRPDIFDLSVKKLSFLYDEVIEVDERVTPLQSLVRPDLPVPTDDPSIITDTATGEPLRILRRPDFNVVSAQLDGLVAKGIKSVAIAFAHSYMWGKHEDMVAESAQQKGLEVSVSSKIQPMIKLVSRANSSIADAYLTPITQRYIHSFASGFQGGLQALNDKLLFMQSDGGLCRWSDFSGLRAILSGPAGGVVGYSKACYDGEKGEALIAVDMGGTSTDVSRYDGKLEHVFETTTAEVIIQAPQLDINTVAAGGGSRLFYRHGMFVVGPESTTAHPGPACYRKGGPLAVTDANLVLGRLLPEHFPKIFGPNENEGLDIDASKRLFEQLTEEINKDKKDNHLSVEEVAVGFLRVANEAMCRPIRTLTEARGFECGAHHLVMFGGAGGQHACSIASTLSISRILIPRFSSVLSAQGMALADVVREQSEPAAFSLSTDKDHAAIESRVSSLVDKAEEELRSQGFPPERIASETYLNCRYFGTNTQLMVERKKGQESDYASRFYDEHKREFGFNLEGREIIVDDIRVRAVGMSEGKEPRSAYRDFEEVEKKVVGQEVGKEKEVFFEGSGWLHTKVLGLDELEQGHQIEGPAIIYDATQTILVEPGHVATVLPEHVIVDVLASDKSKKANGNGGDVEMKNGDAKEEDAEEEVDPVQLSVYGHRLMGIAEQMGDILRKISISLNIKERLDYSCAIFSDTGDLVANAPHVPVHLGAMSHAVRHQARIHGNTLKEGDVLLSNHPAAGGSHLPDLTVIVPAWHEGEIIFWTAARAHHADIGGIRAGSMPPNSKELWEEGAQVRSFKIVNAGKFDEEGLRKIMCEDPAQYPGCSGTRTWNDNLSDLHAQIAACHRGVTLLNALVSERSLATVHFYMHAIMHTAERAVRDLLRKTSERFSGKPLEAVDWLDDGTQLCLKIKIDEEKGDAVFDFTGTGPQVYGNLNTPTAIVYSAIIYVLRCLMVTDLPLNHGCLKPIQVVVPPKSLLSPTDEVAVCAGNVESSQRVTDVIIKAFQRCAASQGGCNNLTFGIGAKEVDGETVQGFGYYETICGGAGAGPDWDGQNCVHVNMTNTSIGDVEITERTYPLIIHQFSRRKDTGGAGRRHGGDGAIREMEFTEDLDVAILSQRRVIPPYGMAGGDPGKVGENWWIKARTVSTEGDDGDGQAEDGEGEDERWPGMVKISLGGMNQCSMKKGDRIVINTPGGGGYGVPGTTDERLDEEMYERSVVAPTRANGSLATMRAAQMSAT